MARPTPILEIMRRLDEMGYGGIADGFRDLSVLASSIKDVRPRIKMTTAYKLAENMQKELLGEDHAHPE